MTGAVYSKLSPVGFYFAFPDHGLNVEYDKGGYHDRH